MKNMTSNANHAPVLRRYSMLSMRATISDSFARGNSRKAVIRRILRTARKMHLLACQYGDDIIVSAVSNKDMRRAQSLQSFLSGKSLARTARNNYARETTVDGKTIPCPNYWHM